MDISVIAVVFMIASFVVVLVQKRRGRTWKEALQSIGWENPSPTWYIVGIIFGIVGVGIGWLAIQMLPREILESPNINLSNYSDISLSPVLIAGLLLSGAINTLGEELFFRGMLGGWLVRKLGFLTGNAIQALLFLLPHLLLLLVSLQLWPLVVFQAIGGWALGWLRHRSTSIFPGWLAHALANIGTAILVSLR
jgi:uncharacterized protein